MQRLRYLLKSYFFADVKPFLKKISEKTYLFGLTRRLFYKILGGVMTRYIHSNCTYVQNYNEGTYTFTGPCRVTGKPYSVTILGCELWDLNQGALIQDALKTVSAEDREFVCSGTSPEGWEKLFA